MRINWKFVGASVAGATVALGCGWVYGGLTRFDFLGLAIVGAFLAGFFYLDFEARDSNGRD